MKLKNARVRVVPELRTPISNDKATNSLSLRLVESLVLVLGILGQKLVPFLWLWL